MENGETLLSLTDHIMDRKIPKILLGRLKAVMRFVPINCIAEGMILGKELFGKNGEYLLSKGSVIREVYIEKIRELGFNGIYITDELSRDVVVTEIIDESLRFKTVSTLKNAFHHLEKGSSISDENYKNIENVVDEIVKKILSSKDVIVNMVDLKTFDDYTFFHSVNVTVLSIVMGVALSLNKNQLSRLGISALLHDIGKVFISKGILNKHDMLTGEEFEIIKSHSFKGYEYLKERFNVPAVTYIGILQHHENFDGEGYPAGLKGGRISLFGRIIKIADVYDALTSRRPYRDAMIPSEAFEYIMGGGGTLFDPEIVTAFARKIAPYPVGTCITLSNDTTGIVVENYSDSCLRPRIKVFRHKNSEIDPYIIDLKNDKNTMHITITGVLSERNTARLRPS